MSLKSKAFSLKSLYPLPLEEVSKSHRLIGLKKLWVQQNCGSIKIVGQKKSFGPKNMLGSKKKIGSKKMWGEKHYGLKKIFGSLENFWGPKKYFHQIYH